MLAEIAFKVENRDTGETIAIVDYDELDGVMKSVTPEVWKRCVIWVVDREASDV